MKILVTGAAGFIGSYLVPELGRWGHEVVAIDHNDADLRSSLRPVLEYEKPDLVVHLAAAVGIDNCEQTLTNVVQSNAQATALLAKDCGDLGIRVAYTSTSEVYGADGSWTEDDPLPPQKNIYGMTKRWGEEVLRLYTDDPCILRLSMPYGPGVPPGHGRRSLDNFLWWAYHREPITVHRGAGRSWCWVEDSVRGMAQIITGAHGGVWNVGRDDAFISMLDLARACCALTNADPGIIKVMDPPRERTMGKRLVTDKLRSLGWTPNVELEEGLPQMLQWVKQFDRDGRYTRTAERQAA